MPEESGGFRVIAEPSPGPTGPPPPPDDGGSSQEPKPEPTPEPSPGPSPKPRPPWGGGPDIGVTPSWLKKRAYDCDETAAAVNSTFGPSQDVFEYLAWAAQGWEFVQSIDEMQSRWNDLNKHLQERLHQAAENFRMSADSYTKTESAHAETLGGPALQGGE